VSGGASAFLREDGMRATLIRRESGLEGDGDVWRRRSNPSRHASPSFVSRSRRNKRGKRRRDGREKHDSGDEFLFPCGSMGNGLRRHGSFLAEGVSKRQRGLVGVPLPRASRSRASREDPRGYRPIQRSPKGFLHPLCLI
jgi:hypothetical protein